MTDGILLAEIQRDPTLRRYDTIIVDEAHERSLNIDFILGYLHQLLPRRPDLKVVITSATIDSARFSEHFGGAPVVEVSGRTYPVEVRYRPVHDPDAAPGDPAADPDRDQISAIVDGVAELQREGDGDILVFLSGEREIRDTADGLRDAVGRKQIRDVDVLPLYARLSAAEQHRVFASHSGQRVVLATNVAETSLTVPGIRYVIDPGTARISRYSLRTKVQRLPIEPVSQASARQRAGRCGRVADGICLRLYSEEDFDSRPEYTDPEILRTNLASVILQMTAIGLGDVAAFPFVEPPDVRAVRDGIALLEELHAIEVGGGPSPRLTRVGRRLVRLPVDPRMARMVLEADRLGCVHEVLVIAAALSIQDPRERPAEAQQAADEQHRRFADERSDFLAHLNLWEYLRVQQDELSSSAFRRMCKREYLHFLRVREWQDLHSQLRRVCKDLKIELSRTAAKGSERDAVDADRVHQALLAGLLSHVGVKDERAAARAAGKPQRGRRPLTEYQGARGISFAVFPGLGAGAQAAGLRGGGRAGRDLPDVGAHGRPGRAGVGGAGGGPPGEAHVRRAALVGAGAGAWWRASGSRSTACRSSPTARCSTAGSTPRPAASCSSGTRWSRATGAPGTSSSTPTGSCSRTSASSSTAPGAATSSSTTRRCSRSTTSGSRRRSSPARTSTGGGRARGARRPTC